jgi:hypothetical protein
MNVGAKMTKPLELILCTSPIWFSFPQIATRIWQLERQAKEGLTSGLSDSPTDPVPKHSKRPRFESRENRRIWL